MPFDIRSQLEREIDLLNAEEQRRLLALARELKRHTLPEGSTWDDIKQFAGTISHEDAEAMKRAIEEDCEHIDLEKW